MPSVFNKKIEFAHILFSTLNKFDSQIKRMVTYIYNHNKNVSHHIYIYYTKNI